MGIRLRARVRDERDEECGIRGRDVWLRVRVRVRDEWMRGITGRDIYGLGLRLGMRDEG